MCPSLGHSVGVGGGHVETWRHVCLPIWLEMGGWLFPGIRDGCWGENSSACVLTTACQTSTF